MPARIRRIGRLFLGLTLVAGCGQATAPSTDHAVAGPAASHALLGGLVGTVASSLSVTTSGVLRNTPLANDITVVKVIGILGGTLSIPEAGVTVTVPYGALSSTTRITMTARKGSLMAYDFAPHGVTFAQPLTFRQSLAGTNAGPLDGPYLRLSYYSDPSLLGSATAIVSELLTGVLNVADSSFAAPIKHFSGYVVTCGRGDAAL